MIEECLVVEVRVTGDDCPLADATRETGARLDARPPQRRADGTALLQFTSSAAEPLAPELDADDRIRYLHVSRVDDRVNYRCLSKEPCVVHRLTDVGFMIDSLQYEAGAERHVGAVVGREVLEGVLETAGETVGVTLERVHPLGAEDDATVARRWNLTPAQEEAIRAAYEMGYFSVPREHTADVVADELGISKTAFLERLRRGQAALFEQLFGAS